MRLRIVSWNIFWGLGYTKNFAHVFKNVLRYHMKLGSPKHIPKIGMELQELDPHVVVLQEIDNGIKLTGKRGQMNELAGILNMEHTQFSEMKNIPGLANDGNAIMSKYKLEKTIVHTLPYNSEPRNCIETFIKIGKKRLRIIGTHFGAMAINTNERKKQFHYVSRLVERSKEPVILLGDLNCNHNSKEANILLATTDLVSVQENPTWPAYKPQYSFDQVLVSPSVKVHHVEVLPYKLSDHLGVVVEIEV